LRDLVEKGVKDVKKDIGGIDKIKYKV